MEKINLRDSFGALDALWSPRIAAELNGQHVKLAKIRGEFVWHRHDAEDEMFLVVRGRMKLEFRDREVWLEEGELMVVPRGVDHRPVAPVETQIVLFEPVGTVNTGNVTDDRTVEAEWIQPPAGDPGARETNPDPEAP
jgi:mannose-6-phosphate isomerase-like protein (cupin superfamily)